MQPEIQPATRRKHRRSVAQLPGRVRRTLIVSVITAAAVIAGGLSFGAVSPASSASAEGRFPSQVSPKTLVDPDRVAVQLGMKFSADVDGVISAVKFYKGPKNTGPHTATLWDGRGKQLATATFVNESSSGWQTATFDSPVSITGGKTYVASYLAPHGSYAVTEGGFARSVKSGHLTTKRAAGVYHYGKTGFPTQSYRNSNYFVDVAFSAGRTSESKPPSPSPSPSTIPSPSPVPTTAPAAPPSPPQTAPGPGRPTISVTLRQVDGGTGYYGKFTNGLPTSDTYFPIGVWFESVLDATDIAKDKGAGINTYVALTDNSSLATVKANGMYSIVENGSPLNNGVLLNDEIDMTAGPGAGYTATEAALPGVPAGKMTYANYGKGVTFWETDAQAARFVGYPSLVSADNYWFTDPNICGVSEGGWGPGTGVALPESDCRLAANYGWTVDRVRSLVSPAASKPVWNFVEDGHPFTENDAPTITGPQIRAAVWSGIIHGARGVIYFNHNFGGSCITQHVLRDSCGAAVRPTITAVNQQITSLAPVLNAPFVDGLLAATGKIDTAVKVYGGSYYILAGSAKPDAQTVKFTSKCTSGTTATVLGESRTIPIANGTFTDSFADGNAVHIYQINGGTCGVG